MTLPTPLIYALLALPAAGVAFLVWHSYKREQQRRAEYNAMAARRGLILEHLPPSGRTPRRFRFTDRESGASLTITRTRSRKPGSTTTTTGGNTLVDLPDPRLSGGLVFYSAEQAPGMAGAASQLMGIFDNAIAKRLIGYMMGEEYGEYLGELTEQPVPVGMALTIMGTTDPAPFFDPAAVLRAIEGWSRRDNAMVAVTESGTRLRLSRDLRDVDQIEALLDSALHLKAELSR